MIDVHIRYIRALEEAGSLNRELEFLPSDEALAERRSEGIGLTAPEFAILLSYTKITLYKQLRDSDLPEDPYLSVELERYFPTPLRERFREEMREHRLRREITATCVVNDLVDGAAPRSPSVSGGDRSRAGGDRQGVHGGLRSTCAPCGTR